MRILITGGHFSPAYSLIKELKNRGDTVAVAGRRNPFEGDSVEALEYEIAKKEKIKFYEVRTGRIQRKYSYHSILSLLRIVKGLKDAFTILSDFKPDIIVTFGGYVAFPIVYVAFLKKIPSILHEQTPKAGLASKLIGRIAKKICISFESSRRYFPKRKIVFTGMPIREEVFKQDKVIQLPKKKPIIYITGGSAGSHIINNLVSQNLEKLCSKFTLIHQTGDSEKYQDFNTLSIKKASLPEKLKNSYILKKFIFPDEIGFVFKVSDLVIARSGINTVVELLALGKPSFLIPLSSGQRGEQLYNAKLMEGTGLGEFLEERYVTANKFYEMITNMMENINKYRENKEKASQYIVVDALERIVKVVDEVYA